ncbi:MAG: hypothetical protein H7338_11025 [Candidatus Sericytochromatia bacterium]|nr:hypothetical protein [Candidatus Sericytochromatia bacterium]
MSFSLSNVFGSQATNYTTGSTPTARTASTTSGPSTYQQDGFASRYGIQTSASTTVKLPLAAIVDGRNAFGALFIKSSEGLLKVGGDGGSFGRFVLNLFAGAVPIFTPKARRAEIANNVMAWVGRADLVRSGCSPMDARNLQLCGISNITDLARNTNPMDQMTLASRMQLGAMQYGFPPPNLTQIAAWVATAVTLPARFN